MKSLIKSLNNLFRSDNPFFELARSGKRITHIAIAIPLAVVLLIVGMLIAGIIGQIAMQVIDFSEVMLQFYNLFFGFGAVILAVWLWIHFFEKRPIKTIGFIKKGFFKFYLKGFASGLLMLTTVIILMSAFGSLSFHKINSININMIGVILLMLLGYIIQGAAEEVLARGWQFQVIGARYKPWLGAIISGVIFMLLHGFNNGISPLALINLFLFAMLLTFFILYDKNIWAACGWHTAWNWAMENIYGLEVSGSKGLGSILNLSVNGPNYITGGEFGPEGSILTTFVLTAGMVIILIYNSKRK